MTTFNNGESGISVRTKINDAIEKVDGAQPITSADINGGTIDGTVIGGTTPAAISGTTITGTSFVTTGDMTFGDNDKAIFGAGSDLQIYHSGSNSHITEGGTGNLIIRADDFRVQSNAGEEYIAADANGAVSLRYDNSTKLATTSTGIDVTGTVTADGLNISSADNISITQTHTDGNVVTFTQSGTGGDIDWRNANGAALIRTANASRLLVGSNGDISFYEDTGTTPKFFWDASAESLGLGTTSPTGDGATLHINGSTANSTLHLTNTTTGSGAADGTYVTTSGNDFLLRNREAGNMLFYTSNAERMRIDSSGNVGIGTSSPSATLDVTASNSVIEVTSTGASTGIHQVSSTGHHRMLLDGSGWRGYDITNLQNTYTYVGGGSGYWRWYTNGTERMRIDSSGNALIGYTSSNGSYKLQVNSQIFATSSTIATSDGRYKENVTPLTGALDLVSALNPVHFDWKPHSVHDFDIENTTIGFIAQEVEDVLADKPYLGSIVKSNTCVITPEETDEDGNVIAEAVTEEFLGIAEGNLVALLTKAIQEQKAIIDALETRITALEG